MIRLTLASHGHTLTFPQLSVECHLKPAWAKPLDRDRKEKREREREGRFLRCLIKFHEQHHDPEIKEENRKMKTHSAIWLFVILVQLPEKSVKINLKKNLKSRSCTMRVESSSTEARFFPCPFSRTKWIKTAQSLRGYFYPQSPRNMGPVSSKLGKNLQKS